jgi:hypothetical protein
MRSAARLNIGVTSDEKKARARRCSEWGIPSKSFLTLIVVKPIVGSEREI